MPTHANFVNIEGEILGAIMTGGISYQYALLLNITSMWQLIDFLTLVARIKVLVKHVQLY